LQHFTKDRTFDSLIYAQNDICFLNSNGELRYGPKGTTNLPCKNGYIRGQNKQKFAGHQRNMASDYEMSLHLPGDLLDFIMVEEFPLLSFSLLDSVLGQGDPSSVCFLILSEMLKGALN